MKKIVIVFIVLLFVTLLSISIFNLSSKKISDNPNDIIMKVVTESKSTFQLYYVVYEGSEYISSLMRFASIS